MSIKVYLQKGWLLQKHHLFLQEDETNTLASKRLESSNSETSPLIFLQNIPLTLINGKRPIKRNELLHTGTTFITTNVSKQLLLQGIDEEIPLSSIISSKKNFQIKEPRHFF